MTLVAVLSVVMLVGGCGSHADMMAIDGGGRDRPASEDASLPAVAQDADAPATEMGPPSDLASERPLLPPPDSNPSADSTPPADTAETSADTAEPPPALGCPSASEQRASVCGHLGAPSGGAYAWVPSWKDGRECAICHDSTGQRTGCTITRQPDPQTGEERAPALCVANCSDCCWAQPGHSCNLDSDCCAPMACVPHPGQNSTCE
jgi:hypothetical protein